MSQENRNISVVKSGNPCIFDINTFFGAFAIMSKSKIPKENRPFRLKSICYRSTELPSMIFILNDIEVYDASHPRCITLNEFLSGFDELPTVQKYEFHLSNPKK